MATFQLVEDLLEVLAWKNRYIDFHQEGLSHMEDDPELADRAELLLEDIAVRWETVRVNTVAVLMENFTDQEVEEMIDTFKRPVFQKFNSRDLQMSLLRAMAPFEDETPLRLN